MTDRKPPGEVTPEQYMDGVARTALVLRDDVRDVNPYELLELLTVHCQEEPRRMAQVLMAMAAMMPPDETIDVLTRRVWDITTPVTVRRAS